MIILDPHHARKENSNYLFNRAIKKPIHHIGLNPRDLCQTDKKSIILLAELGSGVGFIGPFDGLR